MANLTFHPDAEDELQAATNWYLSRSADAARRLAEAVQDTLASIRQFPAMYPAYDDRHRFAVLKHFPYSIVYRVDGDDIRVVAFAHSRRAAGYWQGRV
jgi:plasmid stabilization system protein ParE